MRAIYPALAFAMATLAAAPAFSQGASRLPETTRSESQVQQLNRAMQQRIETQQQNQAIRQELNQIRSAPPVVSVPGPGMQRGTCPAGSIGC